MKLIKFGVSKPKYQITVLTYMYLTVLPQKFRPIIDKAEDRKINSNQSGTDKYTSR